MAEVGAPFGNTNATKGRPWRAAIERALAKRSLASKKEALDDLAEVMLAACEAGDISAIKELGDRLEGKPSQAIEANIAGRLEIEWATPNAS